MPRDHVKVKRPATGLSAARMNDVKPPNVCVHDVVIMNAKSPGAPLWWICSGQSDACKN